MFNRITNRVNRKCVKIKVLHNGPPNLSSKFKFEKSALNIQLVVMAVILNISSDSKSLYGQFTVDFDSVTLKSKLFINKSCHGRKKIRKNGIFAYYFIRELRNSNTYRHNFLSKCSNCIHCLTIVLISPKKQVLDYQG